MPYIAFGTSFSKKLEELESPQRTQLPFEISSCDNAPAYPGSVILSQTSVTFEQDH